MTVVSPLRRLCRLQSKLRLDRVAHHELLDLSRHRHRKFVDELDVARDLVVRDLAVTEAANLVGRQRLAGSRPDLARGGYYDVPVPVGSNFPPQPVQSRPQSPLPLTL